MRVQSALTEMINKEAATKENTLTTENITSEQFAALLGKTSFLLDGDEQSTILSTISETTTAADEMAGSTLSRSYPKLDMNCFIPPKDSGRLVNHRLSTSTLVDEYECSSAPMEKQARSLSISGMNISKFGTLPRSYGRRHSVSNSNEIKKGRFSLKIEKSSYWNGNIGPREKSRFSVVAPDGDMDTDREELDLDIASLSL